MKVTYENLGQVIAALKKCAEENDGKPVDTGAVRTADLCYDVAYFLQRLKDGHDEALASKVKLVQLMARREFSEEYSRSAFGNGWKDVAKESITQEIMCGLEKSGAIEYRWRESGNPDISTLEAMCYVGMKKDKEV